MTEQEAKFILYKASAAYPSQLELEDETIAVWIEHLAGVPFQRAIGNLDDHIRSSRFFPVIADIVRSDPYEHTTGEVMRLKAAMHLKLLSAWERDDTPPPDGYWQRVKRELEGNSHE